jgi:hypothetical protein
MAMRTQRRLAKSDKRIRQKLETSHHVESKRDFKNTQARVSQFDPSVLAESSDIYDSWE